MKKYVLLITALFTIQSKADYITDFLGQSSLPLPVIQQGSSSATVASVSSSASAVTCLAANSSRNMAMLFNHSTQLAYVKYGSSASSSDYTVAVPASGYFEMPRPIYRGIVTCIWASANGSMKTTEY